MYARGEMERMGFLDVRDGGRGCNLWRFGKGDGVGSVGVIMKKELYENVLEVRRMSDCSCVDF